MHDVGHNKSIGGVEPHEIRKRARQHHMTLVDTLVSRLKMVPEGNGTMFDNTMIFYFHDGGETHHSHGWEYPSLSFPVETVSWILLAVIFVCLTTTKKGTRRLVTFTPHF